jgi:Ca2+-binding EF-hand superfamily protein
MRTLLIGMTLASASALPAQAQDDPLKAYIAGGFTQIDKNGDKSIDQSEFDAYMRARYANQSTQFDGVFTEIDKDRDGKISAAEARFNAEFAQSFKALDQSGDGTLSKDELRAALVAAQML